MTNSNFRVKNGLYVVETPVSGTGNLTLLDGEVKSDEDLTLSAVGADVSIGDGTNTFFGFNTANKYFRIFSDTTGNDYFNVSVATNGVTTISTVDGDAALANLSVSPDGNLNLTPAGVTTVTSSVVTVTSNTDTGDDAILLDAEAGGITLRADATDKRIHIESGFIDTTNQQTTFQFIGGSGVGSGNTNALRFINGDGENHLTFDTANERNVMGKNLVMPDGGIIGSSTDLNNLHFKSNGGITVGASTQDSSSTGLQVNSIISGNDYAEARVHVGVAEGSVSGSSIDKDLAFFVAENSGTGIAGGAGLVVSHGSGSDVGTVWGMGSSQGDSHIFTIGFYDGKIWDEVRGSTNSPFDTTTANDKANILTLNGATGTHTMEVGRFFGASATAGSFQILDAGSDNSPNAKFEFTSGGEFRLYEQADSENNYTGFKAPSDLTGTSNYIYELPAGFPTGSSKVLQSTTSGVLTWVDPTVAGVSELNELSDVTITGTPANGEILIYSETSSDFENATISGTTNEVEITNAAGSITIGLPNDVTIGNNLTVTGDVDIDGNDITFAAGSQITSSSGVLTITENVTAFTGDIKVGGNEIQASDGTTAITLNGADVTIAGNLTISGTTTAVNTENMTVEDALIELGIVNGSAPSSTTSYDLGMLVNYYSGSAKKAGFYWDSNETAWSLSEVVTEDGSQVLTPTAGATEMRYLYDASNYFSIDVAANGATTLSTVDSDGSVGHLTLDSNGDIVLDADGANITLKDNGSTILDFNLAASKVTLDSVGDIALDVADGKDVLLVEDGTLYASIGHGSVDIANIADTAGATTIDTFDCSVYPTTKYLILVEDVTNNNYMSTEILLLGDDQPATAVGYLTQYALLYNDTELGTFSAIGSGDDVSLQYDPSDTTGTANHKVRVVATRIASLS